MVQIKQATVLLLLLISALSAAGGVPCSYSITGTVSDRQHTPVAGVVISISDSTGTVTDTTGHFSIPGVCSGTYTLMYYAVGYNKTSLTVTVEKNTVVNIILPESGTELGEVVINSSRTTDLHTVTQTELSGRALLQTRGSSLGETLKELPGLNSVQTGPSLSKPVIHGLHSNRVLIINDGVRQQGQQWGSEHAPEIDPFVANRITVVKGAAGVRYGSDAIGGVVLLSPDPLPVQKGISGSVYFTGASNGRLGAVSAALQGAFDKHLQGLSWRVQGTLKAAGNFRTPHYYLANTGLHEGDFSAEAGYHKKRFDASVYYSQYNTEVGIFAGAESGNLQELLDKFASPRPLTPSYFTYDIDRSYQVVKHDLLKLAATYHFADGSKLEGTFGRQSDLRQEYDSDLPYTTNPAVLAAPQLSFRLTTHTADLIYTGAERGGFSGSMGLSGNTQGNIFSGLRYLIPNFRSYDGGAFIIERYNVSKFTFEAGGRYDYRWLQVYRRNPSSLDVYNSTFTYSNVSGTVGATYRYNDHLSGSLNIGTAWRAPSINELYINGVHFSDASYQIGDSSLKSERALNTGFSINYTSGKIRITTDLYYNKIHDYIYEKPLLQPVTTISGTYPAFVFTQDNVHIAGLDLALQYDFLPRLTFQSKTTLVRGYNETIQDALVYMPADRFENALEYHWNKTGRCLHPYVSLENITVAQQTRVPPNSDYVAPPPGYSLFNLHTGCTTAIRHKALDIDFSIDNFTNVAYRDYLNHFRYYADDLGINFVLRLKYTF